MPKRKIDLAKKRIEALMTQAQVNAMSHGADPAECIFEMLVAAAALASRQQPVTPPQYLLASVLPSAASCAADWFPPQPKSRKH